MKPRLLDLFCGAGGASAGYARAGFDVVGVDLNRSALREYPFECVRMDAMDALTGAVDLGAFHVIHASPPCQLYSITANAHSNTSHPDLVPPVRKALQEWGGVYVIENVPGAPMPGALVLCGSEFNLQTYDLGGREITLRRHRLFESNVFLMGAGGCHCAADRAAGRIAGVYGNGATSVERAKARRGGYAPPDVETKRRLLGIDWMGRDRLAQAIPPAYTEHIGYQLIQALERAA
jgi:DNA (cytosine-5)-methyltransferase 1